MSRLAAWASVAEIVSSVAVVITLVFLILGIRENTAITRATAYDRNIDSLNEQRRATIEDPQVALLWFKFEAGDADGWTPLDRMRLGFLVNTTFGNYEKAYYAHEYGVLGDSEWTRYERQICINEERLQVFPDLRSDLNTVITDDFAAYIVATC